MKATIGLVFLLLALAASGSAGASTVIDTRATWDGGSVYGTLLGEGGQNFVPVATYGQTFQVPADNSVLTGFNVWMQSVGPIDPDPMVFGMYVMAWTGTRATGSLLYDSGPVTLGTGITWHDVSFNNLSLALQPNQSYVFILSASKYFNGREDTAYFAGMPFDAYSGGALYTLNNYSDTSKWTTQDWDYGGGSWDLVFQAQFTAAPEPSSFALIGLGVLTLGLTRARRMADGSRSR